MTPTRCLLVHIANDLLAEFRVMRGISSAAFFGPQRYIFRHQTFIIVKLWNVPASGKMIYIYIFHRNIKLYRESTKQEELGKTWDNGIQRNVYDNIKKCPNTKKHKKQSQNGYSTSSAVHEKYCTKKSTVSDDSWLGFCVMLLFYAFYRGFYKILDFPIFESYMLINNFVEYNERYPFNDVITGRKLITRSVAKGENIWLHHEIIS